VIHITHPTTILLYISEVKKTVLLLSCIAALMMACGKKRESITPTISAITESIYASGNIKAVDQYDVHSPVNAVLLEVMVQPNDTVSVGTPLFKLDGSLNELQVLNAQRDLNFASANASDRGEKWNAARINLQTAKEKLELDSSLYKKQERLWASKIGSEIDLAQRKLAFEQSKNNYEAAKLETAFLKIQLENEKQRAALQRDLNMNMFDDHIIRSAVSGRVFQLTADAGTWITPTQTLATVGASDQFYLELEVDENDIMLVKLNQEVIVKLDSYGKEVYSARVSKIYPAMNTKTRTFTIEATYSKKIPLHSTRISVLRRILCFHIPRNYLVNGNEVWISEKEKKQVVVGLLDYDKVEIISGIDASTTLYKPQ